MPLDGVHALTVQAVLLDGSQVTTDAASTVHWPLTHVGMPLQRLPSSWQSLSIWQLQLPDPLTHAPPLHWSPIVHGLPSSHGAVEFKWKQPCAGLQPSAVQVLSSAQLTALPPVQVPSVHAVASVHASPSSHVTPLASATKPHTPVAMSQVLVLQGVFPAGSHVTTEPTLTLQKPVSHA